MDNGGTAGLNEYEHVKYADVVYEDEGMTTMARSTGKRYASVQPPMLVFKNEKIVLIYSWGYLTLFWVYFITLVKIDG